MELFKGAWAWHLSEHEACWNCHAAKKTDGGVLCTPCRKVIIERVKAVRGA